jgi:Xaa-Pro dipeptidase
MVCYGEGAADPHHLSSDVKVLAGQSILVDGGRPYQMYESDMTRTVFFGEPSMRDREVYDAVKAANLAAKAVIRPGMRCCDIDRAGRAIIEAAGYGKYFTHRLGHNLGLEGHEPPDIGPLCELPVVPGMCFSVEPGIYLPGEMGVRVEDLVVVTEEGCEVLNTYTRELQIL